MAQTSVAQFASSLRNAGRHPDRAVEAGEDRSGRRMTSLTEQDKAKLLEYLRRSHGEAGNARLHADPQGNERDPCAGFAPSWVIEVEVRKKRVLVGDVSRTACRGDASAAGRRGGS